MDIRKESLKKHYEWNGKIEVVSRVPIRKEYQIRIPDSTEMYYNPTSLLNSQEETTLLPL